ncbi:MAG: hypothetical protein ABI851_15585 [Saprospiraceae bacterium]
MMVAVCKAIQYLSILQIEFLSLSELILKHYKSGLIRIANSRNIALDGRSLQLRSNIYRFFKSSSAHCLNYDLNDFMKRSCLSLTGMIILELQILGILHRFTNCDDMVSRNEFILAKMKFLIIPNIPIAV